MFTNDNGARIAIIGTAGRDRTKPMTPALWGWMVADALARIPKGAHVVSGGAAWADHLAVHLFLTGVAHEITLYLPAPISSTHNYFMGPPKSAGTAATFYHHRFSETLQLDTIGEIRTAASCDGCHGEAEPVAEGYEAMFARNRKVAKAEQMLAYTFGQGDAPDDGGTKHTWELCRGVKHHVSLPLMP